MYTSLIFKSILIYSLMIVTLLSSVYVFLALCRRAARRDEVFFHLSFEKTYDEKGRLDLVPKGSLDESSEEYKVVFK